MKAFDHPKDGLVKAPIPVPLDRKKEFHVHVDASSIAIGAILTKLGQGDVDHPIHSASREPQQGEAGHGTGGARVPDHQTGNTGQDRWLMLFQEFPFRVVVGLGRRNESS